MKRVSVVRVLSSESRVNAQPVCSARRYGRQLVGRKAQERVVSHCAVYTTPYTLHA